MGQPVYLSDLCNPSRYSKEEAIRLAKHLATNDRSFHLNVGKMLQEENRRDKLNFEAITRILDILDVAAPSCVLISLVMPLFRNGDSRLQSKCATFLARHEQSLTWARKLLSTGDARVRANVVEGLWGSKSPEAKEFFLTAANDWHHRVVGNAIYGLHLQNPDETIPLIRRMVEHQNPAFRRAAAWLIRKIRTAELRAVLRPLLLDRDAGVKQAAFNTLANI
jgi:HEAT repeats